MHGFRGIFSGQLKLKYIFIGALALGVLVGVFSARPAHAASAQHFVVQVGAGGPGNIDLLQFAPGSLKVHRGDTITWLINGFHNVHVGATKPVDLVVMADVKGQQIPSMNPQIVFPYGAKTGTTYQGDETGSGLPLGPDVSPVFSLVIDVKAGTAIGFLCDIHPGMAGGISVVDDSEQIPDPAEVAVQASGEFGATVGASSAALAKAETESAKMMNASGGIATVQMGNDLGRAAGNQFFPYVTLIKAGESVTWKFGENAIEPHTVSLPAIRGQEVNPLPQDGKPPIMALGNTLAPMTKSGVTVKQGDTFSSGLIVPVPGNLPTFSLTFADPGVYPYACSIHPGMQGVVVVMSK